VAQARRVIGLYGDPDVSWSIVLAVDLVGAVDPADASAAAGRLVAVHTHLGRAPTVTLFAAGGETSVVDAFANEPYGDHDPLLRAALSADGRTLVVAAHHGAVDGLGLLGAAAALAGVPLTSSATGIEPGAQPAGFLRASLGRLVEALVHPPVRLRSDPTGDSGGGDWLLTKVVHPVRPSSGALVMAAVATVRARNVGTPARGRRLLVAMGLSRRPGSPTPSPDRDTAYVRLAVDAVTTAADAAEVLATTVPEPAFPATDGGGIAPKVTRLLSARLGSTVLVSNLGKVAPDAVTAVRFWPVPSGPAGAAIGLASAGGRTTITVRLRRAWFTTGDADEIATQVAEALESASA
jgi:hypothetical protein